MTNPPRTLPDPTAMTDLIRRNARARRLALELTTEQFAAAVAAQGGAVAGWKRSTVVNLEAGNRSVVGVDVLCALAVVLGCSPVDLLIPLESDATFHPTAAHPGMTPEQGRAWFGGRPRSRMVLIDADAFGEEV